MPDTHSVRRSTLACSLLLVGVGTILLGCRSTQSVRGPESDVVRDIESESRDQTAPLQRARGGSYPAANIRINDAIVR